MHSCHYHCNSSKVEPQIPLLIMKAQERAIVNNYVQEMASSKKSVVSLESKILTFITLHLIRKPEIFKTI